MRAVIAPLSWNVSNLIPVEIRRLTRAENNLHRTSFVLTAVEAIILPRPYFGNVWTHFCSNFCSTIPLWPPIFVFLQVSESAFFAIFFIISRIVSESNILTQKKHTNSAHTARVVDITLIIVYHRVQMETLFFNFGTHD